MRRLRTARAEGAAMSPLPRLHPWHVAALGAAAAAVAVAAAVLLILSGRPGKTPVARGPEVDPGATHPTTSRHAPLVPPRLTDAIAYVEPVKNKVDRVPRAFFTRGAERLQHYCLSQLRIFPARPQREHADDSVDVSPRTAG
jgi:hypothetical protein